MPKNKRKKPIASGLPFKEEIRGSIPLRPIPHCRYLSGTVKGHQQRAPFGVFRESR